MTGGNKIKAMPVDVLISAACSADFPLRKEWPYSWTKADRANQIWSSLGCARGLKKKIVAEITRQDSLRSERLRLKESMETIKHRMGPAALHRKLMARYESFSAFNGNTTDRDHGCQEYLADYSAKDSAALIRFDRQWINYSRNYGRYVNEKAGLVIRDPDTGKLIFLRVRPSISTVKEAIEDLKPAAVQKAKEQGKVVARQGDFYFIPQQRWNLKALSGTRHRVRENGKVEVEHPQHGTLVLDSPCKAVRQVQTSNASFGSRTFTD